MKVHELFAGTRSISKAFERRGHETFTIEFDKRHDKISWYADISKITASDIVETFGIPDVVWASPSCQIYSVAAIGHHRNKMPNGNLEPKTEFARKSDELLEHTLYLIGQLMAIKEHVEGERLIYFIENPRAGMRKMECVQALPRYTVTYCQYGYPYQKCTDIWTNHPDPQFKPACKPGAPCHERAPRGSRNGLQGVKGKVERSTIPPEFCDHICSICEELYD